MNIGTFLDRSAARSPAAPAIRLGSEVVQDYASFAARVAAVAGYIESVGIAPGDRVAMFMRNGIAFLEVLQAIIRAGAIAVPINAKLHGAELGSILESADPKLIFVDGKTRDVAAVGCAGLGADLRVIDSDSGEYGRATIHAPAAVRARAADDVAWLFFTSGTTGRSKGAMLTHRNLTLMSASYLLDVNNVAPEDSLLHAAPMSHGSGMYIFPHLMRGAAQIVCESASFDEAEIAAICSSASGVSFFAAPTMVHRLVRHFATTGGSAAADPMRAGLKQITFGGGPMLLSLAREARAMFGARLAQIYGQGECPMTISRVQPSAFAAPDSDATDRLLSSVGQPFDLVDVRIEGARQPGDAGEILAKSDIVMAGYWRDPTATANTVVDGWLRTGDIGFFDADGNLHLSDRSKDVIISGGTNIYSREIEDILVRHPAVNEIAIIGRQSVEWGEEVVAFLSLKPGAAFNEAELDRFCLASLARFKRPKAYYVLEELPKNAYGKIEKATLRTLLSATD